MHNSKTKRTIKDNISYAAQHTIAISLYCDNIERQFYILPLLSARDIGGVVIWNASEIKAEIKIKLKLFTSDAF